MFNVEIKEDLDRRNNLSVIELLVNDNEIESNLVIQPFDCFSSYISNPTNASLDLLYFTSIIYAIDKIIPRNSTYDYWSRDIQVTIPVSNPDVWVSAKGKLKEAIDFLTSDNWIFNFVELSIPYFAREEEQLDLNTNIEHICLFSGGLDSLAGAIDLIDENDNVLLISHIDGHGANQPLQNTLISKIRDEYSDKTIKHSGMHVYTEGDIEHEPTTRGRSILFHGLALFHAMNLNIEEIITPENGVISINLPLTASRTCSNSTKTMHPYFIKKFQEALELLDINVSINNPYLFKTKGEMLLENKNSDLINSLATRTLSCSHGGGHKATWHNKDSNNCGYCIPCMIRRASIHTFDESLDNCSQYGHKLISDEINLDSHEKRLDILALAYFLNQELTPEEIRKEIKLMAKVDDIDEITAMLVRGYNEIKKFIHDKADNRIKGLFTCQLV